MQGNIGAVRGAAGWGRAGSNSLVKDSSLVVLLVVLKDRHSCGRTGWEATVVLRARQGR